MRITCDVKLARRAFGTAAQVVPSKTPLDVIQGVFLECPEGGTATLTGTDLEAWVRTSMAVDIDEPGRVVLPKDKFAGILRTTDDETLTLEFAGSKVEVRGRTSRWVLVVPQADEFPPAPAIDSPPEVALEGAALARCFRRTAFVPVDASFRNWFMGGLLLEWSTEHEEFAVVACDGKRMARQATMATCAGNPANPHGPILSPKIAKLMAGVFDDDGSQVEVCFLARPGSPEPHVALFRSAEVRVSTRLMDGRFPPYRAGMEQEVTHRYTLPMAPLRRAIDQVSVATSETSRRLDLAFSVEGLTLSLPDTGSASADAHVDAQHQGEPVASCYDHRFLSEPLEVVDADAVDVEVCGQGGPMVLKADGFEAIILPVIVG